MNKSRPDSKNPENGVRLEVSIWSHDATWFKGIQEEDEIVVLGMWKHSTKAPEPAQKNGQIQDVHQPPLEPDYGAQDSAIQD